MRYAEGGGLTAEHRAFREKIRLRTGERFTAGEKTAVIAKDLRVSVRSVERWRVPPASSARPRTVAAAGRVPAAAEHSGRLAALSRDLPIRNWLFVGTPGHEWGWKTFSPPSPGRRLADHTAPHEAPGAKP
ncbi:hypothetical protein GCM10010350_79010 [Streptomyces galilaeus]|nr:hypothetical protein GCM10010350_79010 [Streptomyces galilaeus]